ncbi:KTSC domain-containing protein [Paenibacillus sp. GD4]|jgi:hypothetical protein|uniref:KTSC domain-containing protein n=1 Tax=Paenibacillus TaxID=44249 RepID=UPI00254399F9|nr:MULTISPECIES: KTSC domain-containing protein [Paenibacillus]MDQ1911709.1 KTSC domain-containing protein [Paenibacillus sp. GD4]
MRKFLPISSKQIAFVEYDDQSSQMHIQYHTGQSHICTNVRPDQYQSLLQSSNPYDIIVKMAAEPSAYLPKG